MNIIDFSSKHLSCYCLEKNSGIKNTLLATICLVITLSSLSPALANAQKVIAFDEAITLALENDPWLHGNQLKQNAMEHRSQVSNALPDPSISVAMLNLPTDTWDFDQENMAQLKVGISQQFARGDSLAIESAQLKMASTKYPVLRLERKAKLKTMVSELWLDAYLAQQTIKLIKNNETLFEQVAEIAAANYASTVGNSRQHDVISAQLEIIQLKDRLTVEQQKFESAIARLNEWLHPYNHESNGHNTTDVFNFDQQPALFNVASQLPTLRLNYGEKLKTGQYSRNDLARWLSQHPSLRVIDIKQKVSEKGISLAKQQYKPQWGVNASYGYRDNMASGESRADLFSIGVTFDVPLFTENKQDKHVAASIAESQAIKTEKLLLTKKMISLVEKEIQQLKRLAERQSLYQKALLQQMAEQAQAALTAYTHDDGDFSEVVRARISELNTRIFALKINIDALKTVARINYYIPNAHPKQTQQITFRQLSAGK